MRYRPARHTLELPVALGTPMGEFAVSVSNISRSGLRVKGPRMVPKNTPVKLLLKGEVLTGRIAWNSAHSAGVDMDFDLTKQQIEALRGLATRSGLPSKRGPGTQSNTLH